MLNILNKNKPTNISAPQKNKSTQGWYPIKDITNNFLYRKDNVIVSGIRITPINIELLSDKEKKMKIQSLNEVFNGIDFIYQMFTIGRPVDLDSYINSLQQTKDEQTIFIKKKCLDSYIKQAAMMATKGEALDRHFYIFIPYTLSKNIHLDENTLYQRTNEFAANLNGAGLSSKMCTDSDLREVLFIFSNPSQAAFERSPTSSNEMIQLIYED